MKDHITICICTYKRPEMLSGLLKTLEHLETEGRFTYSVLVIDNDTNMSARPAVDEFRRTSAVPIGYHMEAAKGIPVARNRAVTEAKGTFIAFVDDDEFATPDWLVRLYTTAQDLGVAGVLGPVRPHFPVAPPDWIVKAGIFNRPSFKTGTKLDWPDTRTGNVLLKREIFDAPRNLFNPKIGHGEDKDFFRRMIGQGYSFVWCEEAAVYETEPAERLKRGYFLKRALIRGSYYFARSTCKPVQLLKSVLLLTGFSLLLPATCFFGHHSFMKMLIRICDHVGSLAGACGLNVEKHLQGA